MSRPCSLTFFLTKPRLVSRLEFKPVPVDEKTPRMPSMVESRLRPSWRLMITPNNNKKNHIGEEAGK